MTVTIFCILSSNEKGCLILFPEILRKLPFSKNKYQKGKNFDKVKINLDKIPDLSNLFV